ncbi:ABC transporter permease [Sulfitobacter aestuarii]|uniref:ABC transporter permease n=1 Tax=Sulfitobacter aestuarii TaxID=2161676 RepID=A0ABW5U500_9RHOB
MRLRPGPLAIFLTVLIGIFMLMPLLAVVPVSFTPKRFLSVPTDTLSLRHYRTLIEDREWIESISLSLRIGVLSAAFATALATFFSLGMWMFRPRFAGLLMGIALLPMVAPPVVSALTLYFFLITLSDLNEIVAYDTLFGVALAHSVMIVPFAVVLVSVSLAQVDRRMDLAARAMGAGLGTRVFRVILPNIKFGVIAAFMLTFVLSWEEIAVTIFITSVDAVTLPRLMWQGLRDNIDPAIAAISVVLILIVITIVLGKTFVQHVLKKRRAASQG